jgi:hypothetical protein
MYMGGLVIECALKAAVLHRHSNLRSVDDPASLSRHDRRVYRLLWSHSLDELLDLLPQARIKLLAEDRTGSLHARFRSACALWTIYIRYSTHEATIAEADAFLDTAKEVRRCLEQL